MGKYRQCVGCGYCCRKSPCMLSFQLYGYTRTCPALVFDACKKRFICKLAEASERVRYLLYIGVGCCSPLNSDRKRYIQAKRKEQKTNDKI